MLQKKCFINKNEIQKAVGYLNQALSLPTRTADVNLIFCYFFVSSNLMFVSIFKASIGQSGDSHIAE